MRALNSSERPLVEYLLEAAGIGASLDEISVTPMSDRGMGSLSIDGAGSGRKFGSKASECEFSDTDGTLVSATLNLDQYGKLFEVNLDTDDESAARVLLEELSSKLLSNPVIEDFEIVKVER